MLTKIKLLSTIAKLLIQQRIIREYIFNKADDPINYLVDCTSQVRLRII